MDWLDGKKIVDAVYGDSYTPLIQKIYKGNELIFERGDHWDYKYLDLVFQGRQEDVVVTDIKPFDADHNSRGWEFEAKIYTDSATSDNMANKFYVCCNTTTVYNQTPSVKYYYWTGGLASSDNLDHNHLGIRDPGFGWAYDSINSVGANSFRMRGTDHLSGGVTNNTPPDLQGSDNGVAYNVVSMVYDKKTPHPTATGNLMLFTTKQYNSSDELVRKHTWNCYDRYMQTAISDMPVILGACYLMEPALDNNNFRCILGDTINPVHMDFKFRYL
jgi:hypothetical protein